jgi:hypothetical protein
MLSAIKHPHKKDETPVIMKFRHAAALAVMSWLLIVPPIGSVNSIRNSATGFYDAYSTRPFCAWEIEGSYDTAAACGKALDQANQLARQGCGDCSTVAVCIAADDPRLASKPTAVCMVK